MPDYTSIHTGPVIDQGVSEGLTAVQPADLETVATTGDYADLLNIPTEFTPEAHNHVATDVTDFNEAVGDAVSTLLVEGDNITLTYDDVGNTLTIDATGALTAADIGVTVQAYDADTAKTDVAQSFTAAQGSTPVALIDGANIATDAALSNVFTVTLGGNRTLDNPTNLVAGKTYCWVVTQDGTGSRTLAYGSAFDFPGGTSPTLSTAAGSVDLITGLAISTSRILCVANLSFS